MEFIDEPTPRFASRIERLLREGEGSSGGRGVGAGCQGMLDVSECKPSRGQFGTEAVMKLPRDMTFDVLSGSREFGGELAQAAVAAVASASIGGPDRDDDWGADQYIRIFLLQCGMGRISIHRQDTIPDFRASPRRKIGRRG
jgi:hypothetical protein